MVIRVAVLRLAFFLSSLSFIRRGRFFSGPPGTFSGVPGSLLRCSTSLALRCCRLLCQSCWRDWGRPFQIWAGRFLGGACECLPGLLLGWLHGWALLFSGGGFRRVFLAFPGLVVLRQDFLFRF